MSKILFKKKVLHDAKIGIMVPRRMSSQPVFHHSAGTFSALRKKAKHQPAIINTINHAKCSVVPGIVPWIWKKMMNKNDVRELVFTSSAVHTSYRHMENGSFQYLQSLTWNIWELVGCVWHTPLCSICVQMCVPPHICVHVCVFVHVYARALRTSGLFVLMRGEGRQ